MTSQCRVTGSVWTGSDKIKAKYPVKFRGHMGPGDQDEKVIRLLNRIITWEDDGITWEPDPRHVDILVQQLGPTKAKPLLIPGVKPVAGKKEKVEGGRGGQRRVASAMRNLLCEVRIEK